MVSIRYLFEVAELSCLKSTFALWVMSVNRTSAAAVAPRRDPVTIPIMPMPTVTAIPHTKIHWRTCWGRLMLVCCVLVLTQFPGFENSLRLLHDEEVIGGQILEAFLQAGRPGQLHTFCTGRRA